MSFNRQRTVLYLLHLGAPLTSASKGASLAIVGMPLGQVHTADSWKLHAAYLLSMGIYPILDRSQIYSLPVGPNATNVATNAASFLPTPWEASFATLASNPTGSAQLHPADTAQRHLGSQFLPSSDRALSVSHRRSLASSAQDSPEYTPVSYTHLTLPTKA